MRRNTILAAVGGLIAVVLAAVAAHAGALRDDAGFFSQDAQTRVTQVLDRIQQRHGKNVVVETYPVPPPSVPAGGDERARDAAYEKWMQERGKELGADVLILVTKSPAHVQLGASQATRSSGAFTTNDIKTTSAALLAQFRQKNFDDGILQAVESIDRRLGQSTGPERDPNAPAASRSGAVGSGGPSGQSSQGYPPPPGGRTNAPTPVPSGGLTVCGGGMGSMVCLLIVIIGAFLLIRGMMSRRSGYGAPGGYGQPGYGQPGYGQPGYGQPGYPPAGGGFGRGVGGGLLGGLLGSWLYNRTTHGGYPSGSGYDAGPGPTHPSGLPPTDPSTFGGGESSGFASSGGDFGGGGGGGDFGGGGGGGDFGGGGGGGGDSGSSAGGDF